MTSHQYEFKPGRLARVLATTALGLAALLVVLQLGWMWNAFPSPRPALNGDQFMMRERELFVRGGDMAEMLIIGDSSALMGVNARRLGDQLSGQPRVYNLGLFLGLPLDAYGEVAGDFIARHPNQVGRVVLLITTSRLTDARPITVSLDYWRALRTGSGQGTEPAAPWMESVFALNAVQERLFSRAFPFVDHQKAGVFFGNLLTAEQRLETLNGSLFLEGHHQPTGRETLSWEMDALAAEQAASVRAMIPTGVELLFGIMPVPETLAGPGALVERAALMNQLNQSLQADRLLTDLPITMPDGFFVDRVHLNRAGQEWFTDRLARALSERNHGKKFP